MNGPSIQWDVLWEAEEAEPPSTHLDGFLQALASALELEDAEVSILISNDKRIRDLNLQYRSIDKATDVLSFPQTHHLDQQPRQLGDIVISLDQAKKQALALNQPVSDELQFLVLHGLLHLLGYDHETDDGEMLSLQQKLRTLLTDYFRGG